jgi:aromatic ring-opening dioxygenase LigB subunit
MSYAQGMGEVAFAAIAPHGALAISDSGRDEDVAQAPATQSALLELQRRMPSSGAQSVVIFTPHNEHIEGHFAVVGSPRLKGDLADWDAPQIKLEATGDQKLALGIQRAAQAKGLPLLRLTYAAETWPHPMDWGTLIPIWYLGARWEPPLPVAVISPSRDRSPQDHLLLGEAVLEAIEKSDKKVAVIASCDHGHGHQEEGPYGFREESAVFDRQVQEILRDDHMDKLIEFDPAFVRAAAADSWWQMLMLHGLLGNAWKPELLSYEVPTYYGMMVAGFTLRGASR